MNQERPSPIPHHNLLLNLLLFLPHLIVPEETALNSNNRPNTTLIAEQIELRWPFLIKPSKYNLFFSIQVA